MLYKFTHTLSGKALKSLLFEHISVTRVQPRTSSGITDLFLPSTSFGYKIPIVSLRSISVNTFVTFSDRQVTPTARQASYCHYYLINEGLVRYRT
jgi:hypothetical protein